MIGAREHELDEIDLGCLGGYEAHRAAGLSLLIGGKSCDGTNATTEFVLLNFHLFTSLMSANALLPEA